MWGYGCLGGAWVLEGVVCSFTTLLVDVSDCVGGAIRIGDATR